MGRAAAATRRCILGVFAHPGDETSSSAGTFVRYAREGVDVYVVSATRGELGTLGTGGLVIDREDLPSVREAELRAVLEMLDVHPPFFLDYRDQELASADLQEVCDRVLSIMQEVRPDVIITFGPTGISHHEDHIAIHRATVEAFKHYSETSVGFRRLFYVALHNEAVERFELDVHPMETSPTVTVDIAEYKTLKLRALRSYRSQEDAQELAGIFEGAEFDIEGYHQAFPPVSDGEVSGGFWE